MYVQLHILMHECTYFKVRMKTNPMIRKAEVSRHIRGKHDHRIRKRLVDESCHSRGDAGRS